MSHTPPPLQRLTTEYTDHEDRLRLTGETPTGTTVVLWLTQRMANRVIPHLCHWLETTSEGGERADWQQHFAQQAAEHALPPQAPVQRHTAGAQWLVHSIDVTAGQGGVALTFKTPQASAACATLHLEAVPMRQWLGIVQAQYVLADWPMAVWPDWLRQAPPHPRPHVLH